MRGAAAGSHRPLLDSDSLVSCGAPSGLSGRRSSVWSGRAQSRPHLGRDEPEEQPAAVDAASDCVIRKDASGLRVSKRGGGKQLEQRHFQSRQPRETSGSLYRYSTSNYR